MFLYSTYFLNNTLIEVIRNNGIIYNIKNKVSLMDRIYWEKQDMDQLCGVHCLNSLL